MPVFGFRMQGCALKDKQNIERTANERGLARRNRWQGVVAVSMGAGCALAAYVFASVSVEKSRSHSLSPGMKSRTLAGTPTSSAGTGSTPVSVGDESRAERRANRESLTSRDSPPSEDGYILQTTTQWARSLLERKVPGIRALFQTSAGRSYLWISAQERERLTILPSDVWFPNLVGSLQSAPRRSLEPAANLQWHLFAWPNTQLDRFPLTLDQGQPALRRLRTDETRFWDNGAVRLPADNPNPEHACPDLEPLTTNAATVWDLLPPRLAARVILHDSLPDTDHVDLKGNVKLKGNATGAWDRTVSREPDAHGTHVAGVMAASRNDLGTSGVIPGLGVDTYAIPLRPNAFHPGEILLSDVLQGLQQIVKDVRQTNKANRAGQGAPVILLSYAFSVADVSWKGPGTPLADALGELLAHDVVVVTPAGNRSAASPETSTKSAIVLPSDWGRDAASGRHGGAISRLRGVVVTVGAVDVCARPAWFSPLEGDRDEPLLLAPGTRIYSTLPGDDYGFLSGTSMAAAQVAALLAASAALKPAATAFELTRLIENTGQWTRSLPRRARVVDAFEFLTALRKRDDALARH